MLFVFGITQHLVAATPTAEEVLKRASLGRLEFIKVTSELQGIASQISTKEELFPLIEIIPKLLQVGIKLDFESYGANPVLSLSQALTKSAIKWVRFASDSPEFLRVFFQYADNQTRYLAAQVQSDLLKRASTVDEFMKLNVGISISLEVIREFKSEAFVIGQYEELQAETVKAILKQSREFSVAQLGEVIHRVQGQIAMVEVFNFIQQRMVVTKELRSLLEQLDWIAKLAVNLSKYPGNLSIAIKLFPGNLLIDGLGKVLIQGGSIEFEGLKSAFDAMMPTQWVELGNMLFSLYREQEVPKEQLSFLKNILGVLKQKYEDFGISERTEFITQLGNRIAVMGAINEKDAEGIYDITIGDKVGTFILSSTGDGKYIIAFTMYQNGNSSYPVDYGFFYVAFEGQKDLFEAHHFAQGSPIYSHRAYQIWDMIFKITMQDNQTSVEGKVTNNLVNLPFLGKQILKFSPLITEKRKIPKNLSGTYQGFLDDKPVELTITKDGPNSCMGKLVTQFINLPFNYGTFRKSDGALVLTSGELDSYKWAQIKGQFSLDELEFEGFYILSGQRRISKITLKKVR